MYAVKRAGLSFPKGGSIMGILGLALSSLQHVIARIAGPHTRPARSGPTQVSLRRHLPGGGLRRLSAALAFLSLVVAAWALPAWASAIPHPEYPVGLPLAQLASEEPPATETPSPTPTDTPTATDTATASTTSSASASASPTASETATLTATSTPVLLPSDTPTPTASATASVTAIPTSTTTLTPTTTPTPTEGVPSLDPIGWEGNVVGSWDFEWSGMSGIQTWTTPGDGRNWQNTQAHVLFATTNVPTGSVVELCARGNLPFAEWDGGGLLQLPTARPVFNFPKTVSFTYGSWSCERNELDMRYGPTISIGHRYAREGPPQPGIRPPKASSTFTWQGWVKSLNGYEFAEPAWLFEGAPPASPQPKPGLGGASGPGDPRECPIAACPDGQGSAGDPINSGTGSFDFTVVDLSLPAAGEPLLFQRTYTSAVGELNGTPLGFGWTHNQDTRLIFADDPGGQPSMVWFKAHSANLYGFSRFDTATFVPLPGVLASLTREPGPPVTYTLVNAAKAIYTFDEDGKLLTWADAEGNAFSYTYDGTGRLEEVNAGARSLSFSYDDQGRITQVTDQTGRTVSFSYDTSGNLVSAVDVLGNPWTYAYDGEHQLTQITDPRGVETLRTEYDGDGRAVRQFDGLGNVIAEISYNDDGTAQIADARGNVETHTYNDQGLLVSIEDALGGKTTRSYDSSLRIDASTDPGGDTTTFEWNQDGETLLGIVDAAGNRTDYAYDAANNLIASTDARGYTTSFDYSGRLLTQMIAPLGGMTPYTYSGEGFLESVTDPLAHTTTFANDASGQRTSMTDPAGNTWTYAYDDLGRLTDTTDSS